MLIARLITAALLLTACIGAMFLLGNEAWSAALLAVLLVAGWEWGALAGYGRGARFAFCGALAVIAAGIYSASGASAAAAVWAELAVYAAGCVFWMLVAPVWLACGRPVRGVLATTTVGCVALLPAWLAAARLQSDPLQLLQLLGIVWFADSAAYFAGRAWGRHRLAPRISPGKTWEGVAGAAAVVAVYYVVLSGLASTRPWVGGWSGALLFFGVTAVSIVGDLFESWMKRQAGVKDSGALLPGHGGVLDRVDGLLAALPLAALLVRLPT
jgi:phosphatidate cytidylyltransferase